MAWKVQLDGATHSDVGDLARFLRECHAEKATVFPAVAPAGVAGLYFTSVSDGDGRRSWVCAFPHDAEIMDDVLPKRKR